jgi:two-component system, NtrC family, response regulator HydG
MMQQFFGISKNTHMQEILKMIEKIAPLDVNLILIGERGTGKEWTARAIHQASLRVHKSFWPIDCDSISTDNFEKELFGFESISREGVKINRGAFEDASGGTLLLNHIESLPHEIQRKLARAIEYKTIHRVGDERTIPIDVRVIVTLGEQSDDLIRKGKLQKDMFFRISPIVIELPPLRNRREDIPSLIERFISEMPQRRHHSVEGITPAALELCLAHNWPGNIRNLRNAIEYASVLCPGSFIRPEDLPEYLHQNHSSKLSSLTSVHS